MSSSHNKLRAAVRRRYIDMLQRLPLLADEDLAGKTVVFAPHPDDETLGCGGTILRKRAQGDNVRIVFLTDGASSHAHLLPAAELATRRQAEAREAGRRLGVAEDHLHFIACPDGRLAETHDTLLPDVVDLLNSQRPAQVFVTHREEYPADHQAANFLVREACRLAGLTTTLFEYPIWLWDQWPWVNPLAPPPRRSRKEILLSFFSGRFGYRVSTQHFNCRADITQQIEGKKTALAAHATQTTRVDGRTAWITLADVAHGEWLSCCLQPNEYFRRTPIREGEAGRKQGSEQPQPHIDP